MTTVEHITAMLTLGLQKKTKELNELYEARRLKLYGFSTEARSLVMNDQRVLDEVGRVVVALKKVSRWPEWNVRADVDHAYNSMVCGPVPEDGRTHRRAGGEMVSFKICCEIKRSNSYDQSASFSFPRQVVFKARHPYCKLVKEWRAEHAAACGLADRLQRLNAAMKDIPLTAQSMHLNITSPEDHAALSKMVDELIEGI